MAAELFRLFGTIATNANQTIGDLGRVDAAAQRTGAAMSLGFARANSVIQANAQAIRGAGVAITAAGAGIAIALALMTKAAADFDGAMTQSLAIMGDVSDAMRGEMAQAAIDVSKLTIVSAKEAGQAYFYLASAGLDAAQSLASMPQVAKFAQAGMFDMALATDLLTDAQSALGLKTDNTAVHLLNMARVSDVLVKANVLANATVQQFSEALTNKAGAALRVLNKDVEEGVAVLAALADQGVKGTEAGEKLNISLRDLQTASQRNREEWERFGVATYDATGRMRNMADIIEDLDKAFEGMSDETLRATLMALGFQDRSVAVIMQLLGTADAIREYEAGLRSAAGITDEVAKKQLETLNAQLKLMRNRMMEAAILIGSQLIPSLLPLVDLLGKAADSIAAFVKEHPSLTRALAIAAAGFAALLLAIGPLLIVLPSLMSMIAAIVTAGGLAAIGAGGLAVAGTIAAVVVAVVALVGGLVALTKWLTRTRDEVKPLTEEQRALNERIGEAVKVVDELRTKTALNVEEHGRYHKAIQDLAAIYPKYVRGYDAEGKAIIAVTALLNEAREAHEKYLRVVAREANLRRLAGVVQLVEARQAVSDLQDEIADLEAERAQGVQWIGGHRIPSAATLSEEEYKQKLAEVNGELRRRILLVETLEEKERKRRAALAEAGVIEPPVDTGPVGGPEEAKKELAALESALRVRLAMAKTDADRLRIGAELANLYRRFSHDTRLAQTDRNKILLDEINLRRDLTKEQYAVLERELSFRKKVAVCYEAEVAARQGLIDLHAQQAADEQLTEREREAAAGRRYDEEQALLTLQRQHADAVRDLDAARAGTWEQERAGIEATIEAREAEAATLEANSTRQLELQAEILALRKLIWDGDERHLRTLYEINLAEAQSYALQKSIVAAELARTREQAERPVGEGWTEEEQNRARERALRLQQTLNGLNDEAARQVLELRRLHAMNVAEQLAAKDSEIALNRQIIADAAAGLRHESEAAAAVRANIQLEREKKQIVADAAIAELEYQAQIASGYADQLAALEALRRKWLELAAVEEITEQERALRRQRASSLLAAIAGLQIRQAEDQLRLDRAGSWERRALLERHLEQLEDLREAYAALGEEGAAAMGAIEEEIRAVSQVIAEEAPTWENMLRTSAERWRSTLAHHFGDALRGQFRGLGLLITDLLRAIERQITNWLAGEAVGGLMKLLGISAVSPGEAAQTQLKAGTIMAGAAAMMMAAASAMAAASGGGAGGILGVATGAVGGDVGAGAGAVVGALAGVEVPGLAAGAIVRRPTLAVVGEVPELVAPLSSLEGLGGPTFNLAFNAIDPLGGINFILRNKRAIGEAMASALAGNSPVGRRRR